MKKIIFKGCGTAIATPFTEDGINFKEFEKLKEKGMSQKEFSQKTGIAESSISDWKKKHTNPVSDKI